MVHPGGKVSSMEQLHTVKAITKGVTYCGSLTVGKVYLPIEYVGKRVLLVPVVVNSDLPTGILQKVIQNQWRVWIRDYLRKDFKVREDKEFLDKLCKKYGYFEKEETLAEKVFGEYLDGKDVQVVKDE